MSNREWARLAFKLTGLWFMASAVVGFAGLPYLWSTGFEEVRAFTVAWALLPVLVALGIGVPVFCSAERLSVHVFPSTTAPGPGKQLAATQAFALGVAIMGVFLICEAIPTLVNSVSLVFFSHRAARGILGVDQQTRGMIWDATGRAQLASGMTQLLIGVFLLLGPSRLASLFGRVRREFASSFSEGENDGNPPSGAGA